MQPIDRGVPGWWGTTPAIVVMILLAAVPLVWPDIPPLVDLPGHMGRYRVSLDIAHDPILAQFYSFKWSAIGNMGIDLLVIPLAKIFGLELATKLIVMSIPPLTVAGLLFVAFEMHGRIPPTAIFALPLAYGYPFLFGFVNFSLAMALALNVFGLWLLLARRGAFRLRAVLAVPISIMIWFVHTVGWGTLGLLVLGAELVRYYDRDGFGLKPIIKAGLQCLSLAPPIVMMLLWRGNHGGGQTFDWFNFDAKIVWLISALRDRWALFDQLSVALLAGLLALAILSRRMAFSRSLVGTMVALLIAFLVLPRVVFGSAYADMRLVPFLIAMVILAIRPAGDWSGRSQSIWAIAALAFFLVRIGGNTISFVQYDRSFDRVLAALDHVPQHARMVSFVGAQCKKPWSSSRFEHLPAMAIVRRHAFSNDQWVLAGAQLLKVNYAIAGKFKRDPTQIVTTVQCRGEFWRPIDRALKSFPRDAFDYVWLLDPPSYTAALVGDYEPVWRSGTSVLLRKRAVPAKAAGQ